MIDMIELLLRFVKLAFMLRLGTSSLFSSDFGVYVGLIWLVELLTSLFFNMFRIMVSSLRFLLDYENIEDEDDSDALDNDDDEDSKHESHVSD